MGQFELISLAVLVHRTSIQNKGMRVQVAPYRNLSSWLVHTINELVMKFHDKKGITILWDNRQDQLRPLGQFGGYNGAIYSAETKKGALKCERLS